MEEDEEEGGRGRNQFPSVFLQHFPIKPLLLLYFAAASYMPFIFFHNYIAECKICLGC